MAAFPVPVVSSLEACRTSGSVLWLSVHLQWIGFAVLLSAICSCIGVVRAAPTSACIFVSAAMYSPPLLDGIGNLGVDIAVPDSAGSL